MRRRWSCLDPRNPVFFSVSADRAEISPTSAEIHACLRASGNSAGKFPYVRTPQMLRFVPPYVPAATLRESSRTSARLRKAAFGDPCQGRVPVAISSSRCRQPVAKLSKFGSGQKQHLWFSPHPLTERPK